MKADVTKYNKEAYDLITRLDNEAQTIPYFALFSPDDPDHPRLHPNLFTRADMLEFLASAK